ncbi:MAG: FkbM family methyltransferase, partial [Bacillariaceae sp.]|jgi:FkbM family methyltransferase
VNYDVDMISPSVSQPKDKILSKSLSQVKDNVLSNSLLLEYGNSWKVNPGSQSKEATEHSFGCKWLDFESTTGKTAKFCGHNVEGEGVTATIARSKRFHHCNVLPSMWEKSGPKQENSIYLEIGANIGSCVMEMLLSTDAKVIAFEPHPHNQYVLQKSIEALPQSIQDRFVLVPVALGGASTTNTIYAAKHNMGNSMVGKIIKDNRRQVFDEADQFEIAVEPLSSIISTYPDIPLIKLDAQGFECHILDGLTQELANKIRRVKFEVAKSHLRAQGCTDLLSKFRNLGFDIYDESEKNKIEGEYDQFKGMQELMAVRNTPIH